MTKGEAVCQEFCDQVLVATRTSETDDYGLEEIEEINCRLNIEHFTGLVERMVQIGYCCTQVQKDLKSDKCTAWFEPQTGDAE